MVINRADQDQQYKFTFTGLPTSVNAATLFANVQNTPTGGTVNKQISYGQLTGGTGALFEKNTVSLLSIDLNNLQSTGDLTAPSAPASLRSTNTDYSIALSWNASTDNVGVTGYDVFNGGVKVNASNITTTGYTVTGLSAATAYTFTVRAKDAAGNTSAAGSGARRKSSRPLPRQPFIPTPQKEWRT